MQIEIGAKRLVPDEAWLGLAYGFQDWTHIDRHTLICSIREGIKSIEPNEEGRGIAGRKENYTDAAAKAIDAARWRRIHC